MKYIRTAGWDDGVADLTERLVRELAQGRQVLWLASGGSNIPVSVQIMDNISPQLRQNLSISLVDERYGEVGHKESNWTQLMEAGFSSDHAALLPVLQAGLDFEKTITYYNDMITQAFAAHDVVIAQLGIGSDGHIAGILPGSPAAAETETLVSGYQSTPYQRLTLTFPGLRRISTSYTFAFGNTKHQALMMLKNRSVPPRQQPAQILKQLPEAYVYSDQFGAHSA
jgi:6-phosphogluconolactonase/glucosamine-6-phosphate isomerase/deaminase